MASAAHNIDGPTTIVHGQDLRDGAGAIDASLADRIAQSNASPGSTCSGPCWWGAAFNSSSFSGVDQYWTPYPHFWAVRGQRVRIAIAWYALADSGYSSDQLAIDLDLHIFRPNGSQIAYSTSYDNNYEIVDFVAPETGVYDIRIQKVRYDELGDNLLGVAWTAVPDVNLPVILLHQPFSAGEGSTSTSILAQNLTPRSNTVTLNFYQTNGTQTPAQKTATLGPEQSTTFDQRDSSGSPGVDPFQGAAALSPQDAVGVVVQMVRTGGSGGVNSYEAYNGLGETAVGTTIKAPLLMRNVSSGGKTWNTIMSIPINPGVASTLLRRRISRALTMLTCATKRCSRPPSTAAAS